MLQYLALTDGVTLCELTDGVSYDLVSYAPTIAPLRDNQLGGGGPYQDVQDTIVLHALGDTAAAAYAAAAAIDRLLDQARRWWRGEAVSPVTLQAQAQGTTNAASYVAAVKGRWAGGPANLTLPAQWSETYGKYVIQNIQIQCQRRAEWLTTPESASAAAVANPALLSVTMPSSPSVPGPLRVDFTGFTTAAGTGAANIPNAYAFIGPADAFSLQQGEAGSAFPAGGATFTSTADAAARASAGSVGRLDATGAGLNANNTIQWTLPAAFLNCTRLAIYCTYRTNTAAAWTIAGQGYRTLAASLAASVTPTTAIAAAASSPTVLFLGIVGSRVGFDTGALRIARTSSSGGTDTLDIDTILFVDASDPEVFALALTNTIGTLGAPFASKNIAISIEYAPNTYESPFVHTDVLTTAAQLTRGYTGDAALAVSGSALAALWYATHSTFWTTQNVSLAATLNIGATIARQLAAMVPQ